MKGIKTGLNNLKLKAMNFKENKKGASMMEIIVWVSVVLVIATVLFAFRGQIVTFINSAIGEVSKFSFK